MLWHFLSTYFARNWLKMGGRERRRNFDARFVCMNICMYERLNVNVRMKVRYRIGPRTRVVQACVIEADRQVDCGAWSEPQRDIGEIDPQFGPDRTKPIVKILLHRPSSLSIGKRRLRTKRLPPVLNNSSDQL